MKLNIFLGLNILLGLILFVLAGFLFFKEIFILELICSILLIVLGVILIKSAFWCHSPL